MKKLSLSVLILAVIYISMTFLIGGMVEKEIRLAVSENEQPDLSIELLSYQRHFLSAIATSKMTITIDKETVFAFNVSSTISHYPHQAIIKSHIQFDDQLLSERAEKYFNTTKWLTSEERLDLFSQLTGVLTIAPGGYESGSEKIISEPLLLSYQIDLDDNSGAMQVDWAGLVAASDAITVGLNRLQFSANVEYSEIQESDYYLIIKELFVQQAESHSLLENFILKGRSEQGKGDQRIDMHNEVELGAYHINGFTQKTFTDNRMAFAVTGLYQPAFSLLNGDSADKREIESALVELVQNGGQVTLSELNSQTPWGEVDGAFDITLDQGASLIDIVANPYILLDYIDGDASLALPAALLDEPTLADPLEVGVMTGFLLQEGESLNLQTSFQQGELVVNGQVIPL